MFVFYYSTKMEVGVFNTVPGWNEKARSNQSVDG